MADELSVSVFKSSKCKSSVSVRSALHHDVKCKKHDALGWNWKTRFSTMRLLHDARCCTMHDAVRCAMLHDARCCTMRDVARCAMLHDARCFTMRDAARRRLIFAVINVFSVFLLVIFIFSVFAVIIVLHDTFQRTILSDAPRCRMFHDARCSTMRDVTRCTMLCDLCWHDARYTTLISAILRDALKARCCALHLRFTYTYATILRLTLTLDLKFSTFYV